MDVVDVKDLMGLWPSGGDPDSQTERASAHASAFLKCRKRAFLYTRKRRHARPTYVAA
jgi:hypothetical protein